jgi:branched-chain amino acid transport system substrate-binding protein
MREGSQNKMRFRGFALWVFLGICLLTFIVNPPTVRAQQEIKIGVVYSMSGPLASIARLLVNGHEFAMEEINARGGIKSLKGAKLKVILGDAESKPEVAMSVAEKLITQDNVVALLGPYSSALAFPTTQIAEKHKTPILLSGPVADQITERGFKYTFRTVFKATYNSQQSLEYMKWIGDKTGAKPKTVALLYEDTLWGQSQAKTWKALIPKYGFEMVADEPYSKTTQDISPTISKLKAAKPDVILQCSYTTDAILITRTMYDLDFNCMGRIPSGGGHTDDEFPKALGKLANYIIVNSHYHFSLKGPGNKNVIVSEKYKKKYGRDMDDYSGPSYDITWVLADALERAASTDRQKLRDALAATNLTIHNSPLLRPFPYKFDENGQAPATGVFSQFQDAKLTTVWPEEYAASKVVWPMPTWKQRGLR